MEEYNCACGSMNKKPKTEAEVANNIMIVKRGKALDPLVAAAKKKNDLVKEQFMYQISASDLGSDEAKAFLAPITKKYSVQYMTASLKPLEPELSAVQLFDSLEYTTAADGDDVVDADDDASTFDDHGHFVPGAFREDTVFNNVVGNAPCLSRSINLSTSCWLPGSDISQDSKYKPGDDSVLPPPPPSTQTLLEAYRQNNENVEGEGNNDHVDEDDEETEWTK